MAAVGQPDHDRGKPYEWRSWITPRSLVGKRMVIHAGARPVNKQEVRELLSRLHSANAWTTSLRSEIAIPFLDELLQGRRVATGAGLGTALVGPPKVAGAVAAEFGGDLGMLNDSDRNDHANWAWPMLEVDAWPDPVPQPGAQGLWNWPEPKDVGL